VGNTRGKEHLGSKQVLASLLFCCMFKQANMLCLFSATISVYKS